jgi:hypothetical protein
LNSFSESLSSYLLFEPVPRIESSSSEEEETSRFFLLAFSATFLLAAGFLPAFLGGTSAG